MANRFSLLLAIFILAPQTLYLQEMAEPPETETQAPSLQGANQLYQSKIGSQTIHRCPFETSCSSFFVAAIEKNGVLKGTALFIDRYFYRENHKIPQNYEAVMRANQVVYRDDIPDSLLIYLYTD
jgi:putative component of membrane protein insertase Oxa1/YidC/SpoIIIJ protein YidD